MFSAFKLRLMYFFALVSAGCIHICLSYSGFFLLGLPWFASFYINYKVTKKILSLSAYKALRAEHFFIIPSIFHSLFISWFCLFILAMSGGTRIIPINANIIDFLFCIAASVFLFIIMTFSTILYYAPLLYTYRKLNNSSIVTLFSRRMIVLLSIPILLAALTCILYFILALSQYFS